MADSPTPRSPLRREVLLPDRASPGWGALAVAASAMTFALAGSLLMIRATGAHHRGVRGAGTTCPAAAGAAVVHQPEAAPPPPTSCRGPVYQSRNGTAEAVFELCPDAGDPALLRR